MGRIPELFPILQAVGQQRLNDPFSGQLMAMLSNKTDASVSKILPTMQCVEPVDKITKRSHVKYWVRTQNHGVICKGCPRDASGTVGCAIKNPELIELYLNKKKKGFLAKFRFKR